MIKLHKWKYKSYKKILLSHQKMAKILKKKKAAIYDTRSKDKFYHAHFNGAMNISPINLKHVIKTHHQKKTIVLVHDFERTHLSVVSWARWKGYKKVFMFHLNPEFNDETILKINRFI